MYTEYIHTYCVIDTNSYKLFAWRNIWTKHKRKPPFPSILLSESVSMATGRWWAEVQHPFPDVSHVEMLTCTHPLPRFPLSPGLLFSCLSSLLVSWLSPQILSPLSKHQFFIVFLQITLLKNWFIKNFLFLSQLPTTAYCQYWTLPFFFFFFLNHSILVKFYSSTSRRYAVKSLTQKAF